MSATALHDFPKPRVRVLTLGSRAYEPLWRAMQEFTEKRGVDTADEIWLTEHPPVFTLGLNASREHLLSPGDIPVVQIDRGGQVTYHGPGQLMIYHGHLVSTTDILFLSRTFCFYHGYFVSTTVILLLKRTFCFYHGYLVFSMDI
jgi:hypothetical protein